MYYIQYVPVAQLPGIGQQSLPVLSDAAGEILRNVYAVGSACLDTEFSCTYREVRLIVHCLIDQFWSIYQFSIWLFDQCLAVKTADRLSGTLCNIKICSNFF